MLVNVQLVVAERAANGPPWLTICMLTVPTVMVSFIPPVSGNTMDGLDSSSGEHSAVKEISKRG
jgi:hypothetical protein